MIWGSGGDIIKRTYTPAEQARLWVYFITSKVRAYVVWTNRKSMPGRSSKGKGQKVKGKMEADDVNTNKTLVLTGNGGYDKLQIQYFPMPKPGQGEVLVKIKACGINFAELMARAGMYDRAPKCPCVLGLEAAGVVVQLGEGVTTLKVWLCCVEDILAESEL